MTKIRNSLLQYSVTDSRSTSLAFKFLLFWIFVNIGRPQDIYPSLKILPLGDIAVIGIFISFLFIQPDQKNERIFGYTETKLVTLIFILMIILVPFALIKTTSFYSVLYVAWKIYLFFIVSVKLIRSDKDLKYITWTLLLCMFSLSIALLLNIGDTHIRGGGRMSIGSTYDPNDLALVLVSLLPISFMYNFHSNGILRMISIIASITGIISITLTQSRGGLLGLVMITVLTFFSRSRFRIKYLIFLLLLGAIFINYAPTGYWDRMNEMTEEGDTGSGRTTIWKRSLHMIYKNPFGYGIGNFSSAYGRYIGSDHSIERGWHTHQWRTPHNSFIKIAVELGVLGLAIYIFLFYKTYYNFKKIKKILSSDTVLYQYAEFFRISLVGFTLCSFFLSVAFSKILFLIIAISSVMINVIAKEIENGRDIIT